MDEDEESIEEIVDVADDVIDPYDSTQDMVLSVDENIVEGRNEDW